MRFVVFSDIHGNTYALKQMLKDIKDEKFDGYICCGDIAGYYYDQEETIEILRTMDNLYIVKGNHDEFYIDSYKDSSLENRYANKYGSSYHNKNQKVYDYLNLLQEGLELIIDNRKVGIFHGDPDNPKDGRLYPDCTKFSNTFQKYHVCFLGHTHYQLRKNVGNTLIVNPGSIGQPRDGKGFSYCIFDFVKMTCDYRTVSFSKEPLKNRVINNEISIIVKNYLIDVLDRGGKSE